MSVSNRLPVRCHVLSIQDNEADTRLLQQVWGRDSEVKLTTVHGGRLGLDHLKTVGERIPNLILLASRFPITKMSALEILRQFKADPQLRAIPILVLTEDIDPASYVEFYENYASCVIPMPLESSEFRNILD